MFSKILKVKLLILGGIFIVLQGMTFQIEGAAVSAIILILLTVLYCGWTANKSRLFCWFLGLYTLGHILSYSAWYGPDLHKGDIDYFYYIANILFILAYIFLILKILIKLDYRAVFSKLSIPLFILIVLDVFCVSIVTETAQGVLEFYEYILEYIYNTIIMVLLSLALINYMYRNDIKSMMFLMGSICIAFSEIIQLAYFYVMEDKILGFIYSFFLVVAFIFFYRQSQLEYTGPEMDYSDNHLEA
ncbi:hypothetical protein [Winogradskyella sp. KYW1333]|uniref:hypothetical protein n=1 Tax=Winogradskyella sp. KYW1333 TaxID=2282123 RepID=UPI000DF1E099|nr:hypothetical protein [Winogradskyella sp. KYW1333]RCT54455.1 hypothetical protein DUZ96_09615 [Winogradskyella sp. KYW1333]